MIQSVVSMSRNAWMRMAWVCLLALTTPPMTPAATNHVVNGDFETVDPDDARRPLGWDLPDGLGVQWTDVPNDPQGRARGRGIRMDTRIPEREMEARWRELGLEQWHIPEAAKNPIAATYGLSFYSQTIPVVSGQVYRVSFDVYAPADGAKVWVRGYGLLRGEMRRRYETVVHSRPPKNAWFHEERTFRPTKHRPGVTEMKVMLYAFWPPGVYWFDNVEIESINEHPE